MNLVKLFLMVSWTSLIWGTDFGTKTSSLDAMNCWHKEVKQFIENGRKYRNVEYNPVKPLSTLLKLYLQLEAIGVDKWRNHDGFIETDSFLGSLLYGKRVPWSRVTKNILRDLGDSKKIPVDIVTVLGDSQSKTGVCLKESVLTTFKYCTLAFSSHAETIGFKLPAEVSQANENQLLILLMSQEQLSWRLVSDIEASDKTFSFVTLIDEPGQMALRLRNILETQINQMMNRLTPYMNYVDNPDRCNYFLWHALSLAIYDAPYLDLSSENQTEISISCVKYAAIFKIDTRKRRSLLHFSFRDNSLVINDLIRNVNLNVRNDEILHQNDLVLKKQAEALAKNVESLKAATEFDMDHMRGLLVQLETRTALFRMNQDLNSHKFTILGNLRDASNLVISVRTDYERMMDRVMSQLTAVRSCHTDPGQTKISCSYRSGYLSQVIEGRIQVSSPSEAFKMTGLKILSCLYLHDNKHPKKTLFVGNRNGFYSSASYLYNKNISCPRPCFENLAQDIWECDKCLSSDDKNTLPPHYLEPFHYVVNEDLVYLQSISGPVKFSDKQGVERTLGLTPLVMKKGEFPITMEEKLYTFESFIKSEDFSIEGNFFLNIHTPGYFQFKSPQIGTQGLVRTRFENIQTEIRELFKSSLMFRILSVFGIIVVVISTVGCSILIYCRCRKKEQRNVINEAYQKYFRRKFGKDSKSSKNGNKDLTTKDEPLLSAEERSKSTLVGVGSAKSIKPNPPLTGLGSRHSKQASGLEHKQEDYVTHALAANNAVGPWSRRDPANYGENIPLTDRANR